MEELFYFPSFDLLVKIRYAKDTNSIRYATHRAITTDERKIIDRYILSDVAVKTDYYRRTPSLLLYMGVDISLEKELKFYRLHDTIKEALNQKESVDKKVQELISSSLSTYYFERVGDELLKLRKLIRKQASEDEIEGALNVVVTLLEAYNQNSEHPVELRTILPKEAMGTLV